MIIGQCRCQQALSKIKICCCHSPKIHCCYSPGLSLWAPALSLKLEQSCAQFPFVWLLLNLHHLISLLTTQAHILFLSGTSLGLPGRTGRNSEMSWRLKPSVFKHLCRRLLSRGPELCSGNEKRRDSAISSWLNTGAWYPGHSLCYLNRTEA